MVIFIIYIQYVSRTAFYLQYFLFTLFIIYSILEHDFLNQYFFLLLILLSFYSLQELAKVSKKRFIYPLACNVQLCSCVYILHTLPHGSIEKIRKCTLL